MLHMFLGAVERTLDVLHSNFGDAGFLELFTSPFNIENTPSSPHPLLQIASPHINVANIFECAKYGYVAMSHN